MTKSLRALGFIGEAVTQRMASTKQLNAAPAYFTLMLESETEDVFGKWRSKSSTNSEEEEEASPRSSERDLSTNS